MFGSQPSTPFGAPAGGGFGASNSAPAFGSPAPAPFGAPAPSSGFGGFGASTPAPAPGGFGGFGAAAPAPSGGFGGFGTPAPAPSAFGSTGFGGAPASSSPFGAPAPATSGVFGSSPAPASGGLFGSSPAPAPGGFGSSNTGFGGFGSTANSTPAFGGGSSFGAPSPAPGGLFGSTPAPAPSGFGSSFGASSGGFGAPAPAPQGGLFGAAPAPPTGLFGAAPAASGGGGTKIQPYQVTNRQDGGSNINVQAITAMQAYEGKSFEELRFEDYSQGNRGAGTAGSSGGFGGFGAPAPAPAGGLFGASAPAPAFGAPAPAPAFGFGAPAPAPFGSPAPAPFGAPAPAPFGSPAPAPFGAPAPAPGGFGSSAFAAKPPATGLFGAPAPSPGGLFGASPAPATGGLFGSTPAPAPAFGAPAPATGLFGAPAPAPFGAPAPAPFGAPAPAPLAFGSRAPAPGGSLFGASAPAPAFGAPATGGLFGAPAPSAGSSIFGAPKPAGPGFLGAPAPAPPAVFGAQPPATGLFGAPAAPAPAIAAPPVGSVMPPAADEILASQLSALENKRKELEKSDNFRQKPPETSLVMGATLSEKDSMTSSLTPVRASYSTYRASPMSSAKVRPRGFASPEKTPTPSLSRLGSGGKPMAAPDTMAASSATRLIINPSPKLKLKLHADSKAPSPLRVTAGNASVNSLSPTGVGSLPKPSMAMAADTQSTPNGMKAPATRGYDYYQQVIGSPEGEKAKSTATFERSFAPTLTKAGYSCSPSIEVLASMTAADLAAVADFSVERPGIGKIAWEGAVDVRDINLNEVVIIESKAASVYMKEESENRKPPVGTKLNRSAIITLEDVFPSDTSTEGVEKFSRKVERQTKRMGADLIDYDPMAGTWKLRVQHFSRYGLDDDDSEVEEEELDPRKEDSQLESRDFEAGEREGRSRVIGGLKLMRKATPYKPAKGVELLGDMEEDDDTELVSDVEMADDVKLMEEAERAYAEMQQTVENQKVASRRKQPESVAFPEEADVRRRSPAFKRYIPTMDDLSQASSRQGGCEAIARKVGMSNNSTDFGRLMGKSFRAGWSPDGSFVFVNSSGSILRRRPKFAEQHSTNECKSYLKKHLNGAKKIETGDECPQFSLPTGKALSKTLNLYVDSVSDGHVPKAHEAFSLLNSIASRNEKSSFESVDSARNGASTFESRRLHAVQLWLSETCAKEVNDEVKDGKLKNLKHAALLAAVSGGNIEQACEVADELGFHQLAAMLAGGPTSRPEMLREVLAWTDSGSATKMPDELIRAYFVLAGDLHMEEDMYRRRQSLFDWRRRLAMVLCYETLDPPTSVASLIVDYDSKVSTGSAPFPYPRHLAGKSRERIECLCYRILRLGKHKPELSLREVIDPIGHTDCIHDFSLAFHLAAAISAMECSAALSEVEEQSLIDGYIAQLVSRGDWDWAVYVSLCSLAPPKPATFGWKQKNAKALILRNFNDNPNDQKRAFLEELGVPAAWFEEALALRSGVNGDVVGFLEHMVKVNPAEACAALESTIVPNMLFMGRKPLAEARSILEAFSVNPTSLAGAMLDLFQIYEDIQRLELAQKTVVDSAVPSLLERCKDVEEILASHLSGETNLQGPALGIVSGSKTIPISCFLAEGLSQISLFKLQLRALQSGMHLSSTATQILNLAHPSDIKDSGISARENILRWLL